ncbi:uncharacterized protein EAF01_007064 [Botrytis porri]|uniref:Uncharacterized protein n=1 Tax=Botrytis porri TaxID=87229 RepID=A0A4Z1KXP0_9HELO|nr:uncharacterized protein EAF01_007064 [Botrytis porri]KAF7901765.1 hypothetical protein EAF01_007064 [Botrytis porri]TGO89314.1 hypothetical protein BPOR_0115g00190 [Botrytis porri]
MAGKPPSRLGGKKDLTTEILTFLLARFAKIHRSAEERFNALRGEGHTLEVLEYRFQKELQLHANLRTNAAQISKAILNLVQHARATEFRRADDLPTSGDLQLPPPKIRSTRARASLATNSKPKLIVKLKVKNGCFEPTVVQYPSTSASSHTPTGYLKWQIRKSGAPVSAEIPTVVCPETLEYKGYHLDRNQLYYNALARRAGTKEVIKTRINDAMKQGADKEEATRRAHSYAESRICILIANYEIREEAEESEEE